MRNARAMTPSPSSAQSTCGKPQPPCAGRALPRHGSEISVPCTCVSFLPTRRAVRRQPTENDTFDVSINKRRRPRERTSTHWCAGNLWAVVSAERNATIVRFPLAGAMHLKCKPEEKGSFLRPFYIKVHGTWSFLDGWVKMSGRIDI